MKILFIFLMLTLVKQPILADEKEVAYTSSHVAIEFRNPISMPKENTNQNGAQALAAMVILQSYDSINSARAMRRPNEIEMNSQYKWAAKNGIFGYALSFAAFDALEIMVAKQFHVNQRQVETYQAEQSAEGIIYTNTHTRW